MDIKQYYIFIDNFMISYGYRINTHDADDVFQRACVQALEKGDEAGHMSPFLACSQRHR